MVSTEEYLFGCETKHWEFDMEKMTTEKGRPYLKRDGTLYNVRPRKPKTIETEANKGFQYEIKTVL